MLKTLPILALTVLSGVALAASDSPVGKWKTIDDKTGKPKGVVEITEQNGVLTGRIVGNFPKPGEPENPVCDKCEGDRKGKPIIGLVFLEGLKKNGNEYTDGKILDPENGNIYSSKLKVIEGGKKLEVRGFIGISLIGRSQTWVREE
ncbi:uncharacterized protein (DUF2147 family) [Chitinivorax tropicus]|uniref:Uncharacterized protein (DUF2147 family) n=1 Tax=Chitinivorax tropicus TaxID=714531 RepID=A0A840MWY2_9PROT|nr:DUF2147 domain-containing protein [Chitinivorax tropicus]MBB5019671.1 uncharacterized protein (DUF2147 family) [Chitinivorax tropicus]